MHAGNPEWTPEVLFICLFLCVYETMTKEEEARDLGEKVGLKT